MTTILPHILKGFSGPVPISVLSFKPTDYLVLPNVLGAVWSRCGGVNLSGDSKKAINTTFPHRISKHGGNFEAFPH